MAGLGKAFELAPAAEKEAEPLAVEAAGVAPHCRLAVAELALAEVAVVLELDLGLVK